MSNAAHDAAERPRTKVSVQEELLYGPYASLVRRLGRAAEEAEALMDEVVGHLRESARADELTRDVVRDPGEPSPLDAEGRTEHTRWLQGVYDRVSDVRHRARVVHQDIAQESLERWIAGRRAAAGVDEDPPPLRPEDGMGRQCWVSDDELTEATVATAIASLGGKARSLLVGDGTLELIARRVMAGAEHVVVQRVAALGEGRWLLTT